MADVTAQSTKIRVRQMYSGLGRKKNQIASLKGLGLNKVGRSRTLENTPSVRGMINRVSHLVKVDLI